MRAPPGHAASSRRGQPNPRRIDLAGKRIANYDVICVDGQIGGSTGWLMRCVDCGREKTHSRQTLQQGKTKPCIHGARR